MRRRRVFAIAALLGALTACSSTANSGGTGSGTQRSVITVPPPSTPPGTLSATPAPPSAKTSAPMLKPTPGRPVRTASVKVGAATYAIEIWVETSDTDCASHAHGTQVIAFLRAHPCRTLRR